LENTGHECVWANEILPAPRRIYERQFGHAPDPRDIRNVSAGDLPDADLLCGGFPCATFSVAGKRTGFSLEDTRGTLAFEMFRLARDKRIPYILFENVKGLLNHDNGRTFAVILGVLDEMGYDCQWELLNSENFGVPQHRERIFVVANLRGHPRPKVFPIGRTGSKNDRDSESEERAQISEWSRRDGAFRHHGTIAPTLLAAMGTGGGNVPYVTVKPVLTVNRDEKRQNGRRIKDDGDSAFTLTAQDRHGVALDDGDKTVIRKLTPLECERLQGFPDEFTKYYEDGSLVSDNVRYERLGRTITIPVVEEIGKGLHVFF
jgi:DNA (cytosine-5)-methyltransferase 1